MVEETKQEEKKTESAVEKAVKADAKPIEVTKVELEREYIVPLRREFLKVANYRKARRAVKTLKQFLAKHMKVENRDVRLVKLDNTVNHELWYRGIKNPLHKIKVKAVKRDGIVYVQLAEIPDAIKYKMQKQENRHNRVMKTDSPKKVEKKAEETAEQKKDESEKEKSNADAAVKENKKQAKAQKHTTSSEHQKKVQPRRTVLQK